jgi:tetratricopeptide (TPR) repeat protein
MNFNDYVTQGVAFFEKNEFETALENFKAALQLNPDNANIQNFIMTLEERIRMEKQASQALADEAKHRAEAMGIKVEDVDRVITEYTETIKRNPNDASVKNGLALVCYIRGLKFMSDGDYGRAINDYNEAIKNQPDYPLAFSKRGQAYLANGDCDNAIADFEELIRLNPNNKTAENLLANAYMKRGITHEKEKDYVHAISDYETVLKFKPEDTTVRQLLEMAKAEKAKQ